MSCPHSAAIRPVSCHLCYHHRKLMEFSHAKSDLYVPDSIDSMEALARTTHLGIGAHQDDLEFMALHGILECFQSQNEWFGGVTCTDGAGSSRAGPYADWSDEEMKTHRLQEQRTAAAIGQYGFMAQLGHPSSTTKDARERHTLVDDLEKILRASRPKVVYTHNPFDKHKTHIGVLLAVLEATRRISKEERPQRLLGCEVWRGLDWLPNEFKVVHKLDAHPNLSASLNGVFDSQITGGKRYDLAVEGRRMANATFCNSHSVDDADRVAYAIDMSVLMEAGVVEVVSFCEEILQFFRKEILENLGSVHRV